MPFDLDALTPLRPALLIAGAAHGAMLRNPSRARYMSMVAKRADFVPVAVIEYQGAGHHGSTRKSC